MHARLSIQKTVLLLLICTIAPWVCQGQRYSFQQYTLKDGLPQSQVGILFDDPQGYLWIGQLAGGLTRYDGKEFVSFNDTSNAQGLGAIFGGFVDDQSNLWVQSTSGLFRFDGRTIDNYGVERGYQPTGRPGRIVPITKDFLFLQKNQPGILPYVGLAKDRVMQDSLPKEMQGAIVNDVEVMPDGTWLLGCLTGELLQKNHEGFSVSSLGNPGLSTIVDVHLDVGGRLWLVGREGMFMWDGVSWHDVLAEHGMEPRLVTQVVEQKNGALWFVSLEGAYRLWNNKLTHFGSYEGLTNNQVFSALVDAEDNVWLGTYGEGIFKFSGDRFRYLTEREGLTGKLIMGVEEFKGDYYLSDFGKGIFRFDPETQEIEQFSKETGLPSDLLLSSTKDREGNLIFAYRAGGFSRYDGSTWQHFDYPPAAPSVTIGFAEDEVGNLWIADLAKGLYRYDGVEYERFTTAQGLPSNIIRSLYYHQPDSALWIGTGAGMVQMKDGEIQPLPFSDQVQNYVCFGIRHRPNGHIWMTLLNGGIGVWDGKELHVFSMDDGLASNITYLIEWDLEGHIYVGTEKGVDRMTLSADYKVEEVRHYGYQEGFLGIETNGNASSVDDFGRIWMGTIEGVMILDPGQDRANAVPPSTQLLALEIDYSPVDWEAKGYPLQRWGGVPAEAPSLHWRENTVTFTYAGISLTNPESVAYQYMLEGEEEAWSPVLQNRQVTYSNLAPGTYTFLVKARNKDGYWTEVPASFTFHILPPFWQTTWFLILALVASAALILGLMRWRTQNLRHAKQVLEGKVRERTEEIMAQKEEIEAQRDMIEDKNKNILDSLRYAQRIQSSILPLNSKIQEAFPEHFIYYQPLDIVSGDFYWFAEQGDQVMMAAVDCTGHGVPGAFMSLIASQHLNQLAVEEKIKDPKVILSQLNERIQKTLHQKGAKSNSRDGLDIALMAWHPAKRELSFSGAKRPMYLVQGEGIQEVKGDRLFIGGGHQKRAGMGEFTTHTLTIDSPTTVYLSSDGYADQFGGPMGRKFMTRSFKGELEKIQNLPMKEQGRILGNTHEAWKGKNRQTDDILVIGVRLG